MKPKNSHPLKTLIINGILVISVLSLKLPLEQILNKILVNPILSNLRTSFLTDILILALFVLMIYVVVKSTTKPSVSTLAFVSSISTIYIFYRLNIKIDNFYNYDSYNLYSFESLKWLRYTDIIWGISLILFPKYFIKHKPNLRNQDEDSLFLQDIPISSEEDDELMFRNYVEELSKRINSTSFKEAFAIAINAQWGMGKTSFLNLLGKELKKSDSNRIMKFDPWKSTNSHSISKDFFALLEEEIDSFELKIKSRLREYSDKLEGKDNGLLGYLNRVLFSEILTKKSKTDIYKQIKDYFSTSEKKFIVFIDDIDRLDSDEILEILRLVRNTANFPNISYILAYDREYVMKAIKSKSIANPETYLEKIIQLEIPLPSYTQNLLSEYFKDVFINKFGETTLKENGVDSLFLYHKWLQNIRDINRFINALELNYARLKEEVDFTDYFRLELLRFKYPSVHRQLFIRQYDFLDSKSEYDQRLVFKFQEQKEFQNELSSIKTFKYFLLKKAEYLSLGTSEINEIVNLTDTIFPTNSPRYELSEDKILANYPNKFNRYFTYQLQDKELSNSEFKRNFQKDLPQLFSYLEQSVSNGLELALAERLSIRPSLESREDFEKYILAMLHFSRQKSNYRSYNIGNLVQFNSSSIITELLNWENSKVVKYYNGSTSQYKEFLIKTLSKSEFPHIAEMELVSTFLNQGREKLFIPLEYEELISINLKHFENYCSETQKMNSEIWQIYKFTWSSEPSVEALPNDNKFILSEASSILRAFILEKDFEGFLKSTVFNSLRSETYHIDKLAFQIIEPQEISQLLSRPRTEFMNIFKKFFQQYEKNEFNPVPSPELANYFKRHPKT